MQITSTLPCDVLRQELLFLELLFAVARPAQVVDVLLQLVEEHLGPLNAAFHLMEIFNTFVIKWLSPAT